MDIGDLDDGLNHCRSVGPSRRRQIEDWISRLYYLGQKNRIMNIGHNGMKKTKKNFVQR